jgi:hypothetical protein
MDPRPRLAARIVATSVATQIPRGAAATMKLSKVASIYDRSQRVPERIE